ncbi:ATP-binding protein [Paenibacillus sp. LHD-117]|uniref:ATP-binding protein n=1 Tax=Paenibacillus sp. LHD-117 TaxID=3071412 RepID=UPI0027DFADA6|nr:ATP-binding protein [Paenibacillus sp. LHD-117]MDQ6423227.1 ATP-binding protein [Paenibacillus sp. LHD-117]
MIRLTRDYGKELDSLKQQLDQLQASFERFANQASRQSPLPGNGSGRQLHAEDVQDPQDMGAFYFSGQFKGENGRYKWEPQERSVRRLLDLDGDKTAKILSALGHKQRIDILRAVLQEPLTGAELVDRLNMGTTGQLYHHIKALQGADLLAQEERGGKYTFPGHRALPFLLLLAAASELLDTSEYMELAEARNHAGDYLGASPEQYDPHHLLRSVLENSILEHQAGYCSDVSVVFHNDGSVTVADNGRGIPVQAFPNSEKPRVQAVLTEISRFATATIHSPGGEKGISMPIVNALSQRLTVEVRREGKVFRQDYKHGIPQTSLLTVGLTSETGTSLTFLPDKNIFQIGFDHRLFANEITGITKTAPNLKIHLLED